MVASDLDRSVNPISTGGPGGADYAHYITTCPPPPEFQTLLRPCKCTAVYVCLQIPLVLS